MTWLNENDALSWVSNDGCVACMPGWLLPLVSAARACGQQKSEAGPDAEKTSTTVLPHPARVGTASHQDTAGETPEEHNDRGGTRTHDLTLKRRLLYR